MTPIGYISTGPGNLAPTDLATALRAGLAPDGGLYVPDTLPHLTLDDFSGCHTLPQVAERLLRPFCAGSVLEHSLDAMCDEALDLPLPISTLDPAQSWMLELFHGPTAAFKDFAARFLATCLEHLRQAGEPVQTVLVATSGDTGAAVAAAFDQRPGFRVVILYPEGRVSPVQAHQLGAFGNNVHTFRVNGDFDDCQKLAKHTLNDPALVREYHLTSANSISLGRLLPQMAYYAWASLKLCAEQDLSSSAGVQLIVPTGNLGNALAAVLAREMGLPIGDIFLATNANRTLPDFFASGNYQGRPGMATLANAMDVGDPSNFDRLRWFYRDRDLRNAGLHADSISDDRIGQCIRRTLEQHDRIVCPHTACALEVLEQRRQAGDRRPFLIAATAHPAKFTEVVEPLLGRRPEPPPTLAELLRRPTRAETLQPEPAALQKALKRICQAV